MGFAAAGPAVAALAVVSAAADIAGGASAKSAANAEGAQYENNAKRAMIAADQTQDERLRDLRSTLSSIDAIRAGAGLDVTSPTGMAIRNRVTEDAQRNISTDRANALSQASGYYNAATAIRSQGQAAYLGGFLKAGGSLLKAFAKPAPSPAG